MRVPRVHAKERPPRLKAPETAELGSTELYNPWSSFSSHPRFARYTLYNFLYVWLTLLHAAF